MDDDRERDNENPLDDLDDSIEDGFDPEVDERPASSQTAPVNTNPANLVGVNTGEDLEDVGGLTILDVMTDPKIFGSFFDPRWTWRAWITFLTAAFGLPLRSAKAQERFSKFTARVKLPTTQFKEAWLICGRRAGKSRIAALIAIFLACFRDYSKYLAPGERGTVVIIAADRKQARVIFRYIRGVIDNVPFLKARVESDRAEAIDFKNNITIEVHTASFRAVRGYTLIAAICDEIAFWRSEETSANPDEEILNGLRPGLGTIPGSMLICLSSPWARQGAIYKTFKRHYGKDESKVLVWNASTKEMNPIFNTDVIDEAYEDDAAKASAEYGGSFRKDIETYVTNEILDGIIIPGRAELPQSRTVSKYFAFVDPSGGTSDSMTLAIAHRQLSYDEGKLVKTIVLDKLVEVAPKNGPFSPEVVVKDFAKVLREYRVARVVGDRYGGEWPREQFKKRGIIYETAELVKSDLYKEFLPIMNSGNVELLDHTKMRNQLLGLERISRRGGREQIDHSPGAHDDIANVTAGVCVLAYGKRKLGCTWGKKEAA
jgi:hypothetical protein